MHKLDQNINQKPDQQIKNQIKTRCNSDVIQMQYRCNSDAIRCIIDIVQMQLGKKLDLQAMFTTFMGGWVGGWVGGWCGEVKTRASLSQVRFRFKQRLSLAKIQKSFQFKTNYGPKIFGPTKIFSQKINFAPKNFFGTKIFQKKYCQKRNVF